MVVMGNKKSTYAVNYQSEKKTLYNYKFVLHTKVGPMYKTYFMLDINICFNLLNKLVYTPYLRFK